MHIGRKIAHLYKCHVEIMHVVPFICNCFKMPPFCCIYGVQYLWFYKLQMFFDITKDHIIIASKDISEATLSKYLHQDNWKTWMKNIVFYVWIISLTSWMCHSLSINHDFICVSSLSVAQTSPLLGYLSEPSQKEAAFLFVHFLLPQCSVYFFTVILTSPPQLPDLLCFWIVKEIM